MCITIYMDELLLNINILLNRMEYIDELLCIIDPNKKQKFRDENSKIHKNIKPFIGCANITKQSNDKQIKTYYESLTNLQKQFKKDCFDINTLDNFLSLNNTVLHWAIFNSCVYSVLFLISNRKEFNLNINIQERSGLTPLHSSIIKGRTRCNNDDCVKYPEMDQIIDLLIDCDDLDITIKDKNNNTVFDLAVILYDYPTVLKIREKYLTIQPKTEIINNYKKITFNFDKYKIGASYYEDVKNNIDKQTYLTTNYNQIKKLLNL